MAVVKLVLSTPLVWIIVIVIVSIVLTKECRNNLRLRRGWYTLIIGLVLLFVLSFPPFSDSLVYQLEKQYQSPSQAALDKLDIVVILGGGVKASGGLRERVEASGATYSRVYNGVEYFKKSSAKLLVLSGAAEEEGGETNAEVMRDLALRLGVRSDQIVIEPLSNNTAEHLPELIKKIPINFDTKIGIVTSALHMYRAMAVFKKQFVNDVVAAIPVGYISGPVSTGGKRFIPSVDALANSTAALHELIGVLWYGIRY